MSSALLMACSGNKSGHFIDFGDSEADTLLSDTLEESADTLLLDLETIDRPLPETVDELFNDFLFSFDQSNRLQRSRIQFPLRVIDADGTVRHLDKKDWQHHFLLLHQDFCTVLWNSRRQMELAQDSSVCEARVDQIYLHSRQIESFIFQRDSTNGLWMLTEQCSVPFDHTDLAPFLDFYREFATDSLFQRRHVADPLSYITNDNDEFDRIKGNINRDQWFEFQPDLPEDVLVSIAYGQTYNNRQRMLLQLRGISDGLQSVLVFQRDGNSWRLTELEN